MDQNGLPEKTNAFPEKTCPWSKMSISRPKLFFRGGPGASPKKRATFFRKIHRFFGRPRKITYLFFRSKILVFEVFSGGAFRCPNIFSDSFRGSFRDAFLAFRKLVFGVFSGAYVCFFGRLFVFSGAGLFFGGKASHRADSVLGAGRALADSKKPHQPTPQMPD